MLTTSIKNTGNIEAVSFDELGFNTTGLISMYYLNNNAIDSFGGKNGTITGTTGSNDRFGRSNYAISFNGTSSDYINVGSINLFGGSATAVTIGSWFYYSGDNSTSYYINQKRREFQINYLGTTNIFRFRLSDSSTDSLVYYADFSITKAQIENAWHHVVGTWDGAGDKYLRLYFDGQLVATSTMTMDTFYQSTNVFYIGRQHGGFYWKGILDEQIYLNRAMSSTEIYDYYQHSLGKFRIGNDGNVSATEFIEDSTITPQASYSTIALKSKGEIIEV